MKCSCLDICVVPRTAPWFTTSLKNSPASSRNTGPQLSAAVEIVCWFGLLRVGVPQRVCSPSAACQTQWADHPDCAGTFQGETLEHTMNLANFSFIQCAVFLFVLFDCDDLLSLIDPISLHCFCNMNIQRSTSSSEHLHAHFSS